MTLPISSVSTNASCPPPGRLDAYFDHELAEPDRQAVQSHLAGCAACREALERIESASALVKSIELPAMSQMGRARVMRQLTESAATTDRWLLPIRLLTAVAAAVFLIASALIVYQLRHTPADTGPGNVVPAIHHPPAGPGSAHILPTGSNTPSQR